MRMTKRRVLVVSAGLLIVLASLSDGSDDPDAFAVRFENDLSEPVVLALCNSDHSAKCDEPYYRDEISAGRSYEVNISTDLRTEWAIETSEGQLLRCVVLYWKHYPGAIETIRVSTAPRWTWPCPDWVDRSDTSRFADTSLPQ